MSKRIFVLLLLLGFAFALCILAADMGGGGGSDSDVRTPDYYESHIRAAFKADKWVEGKRLLDEALEKYPAVSNINELAGYYYYHANNFDDARYYLIRSVRNDNENVRSKQLLVNVEDTTGNFSSAICYVNELLEVNPYWKGLWRRKILLYRKQGNDVEADRLLKRICQIYPDDRQLNADYADRLGKRFKSERHAADKSEAIATLYELVKTEPNEDYFLALSNYLLQQGRLEEAKEVAARGAEAVGSVKLVEKKASILAGEFRYAEAMAYVKSYLNRSHSAYLASFYNGLLVEAARAESQRDPYVLYGKVYESQKSEESLNYLLTTAMSRGYDEDALFYIAEARKRKGDTPELLYKAYVVNHRAGNEREAENCLQRLYDRNPANEEIADEMARLRTEQAARLMVDGEYAEALTYLTFATSAAATPEVGEAAWNKVYACNYALRRYTVAETVLDSIHTLYPDRAGYVEKKADLLNRRGRVDEALALLRDNYYKTAESIERLPLIAAYEEIAVPHIKSLLAVGAYPQAATACDSLLRLSPASSEGLQYAVNAAAGLGRWDDFDRYVAQGRNLYPADRYFVIKQADAYNRTEQFARAIDLVQPWLTQYPGDSLLRHAYTANSAALAEGLIARHEPDSALMVLNSALLIDAGNRDLLYTKGLAYEARRDYDSAYVYQRYYRPDFAESIAFRRHIESLQRRGDKNELTVEYLQGRYGEDDVLTAVGTVAYTRKLRRGDAVTARVNYAGRDGDASSSNATDQVPGGVGLQFGADYAHRFSDRWTGTVSAAYASRYFPQFSAALQFSHTFNHDWEGDVHIGYRRINAYKKAFAFNTAIYNDEIGNFGLWSFDHWERSRLSLFTAGVGAVKNYSDFRLTGRTDFHILKSKFYVNATFQAKYFPLADGLTSIYALAGVGSAPEATLIDNAMTSSFERLNTMVGLGGDYFLSRHLSVGVLGTWHTFYHQTNTRSGSETDYTDGLTTRYKNLFNVDLYVTLSF